MNILMMGGQGEVGHHLVPRLLALGHQVQLLDLIEVAHPKSGAPPFSWEGVKVVIQLSPAHQIDMPSLTKKCLDAAVQAGVEQWIFGSSYEVYAPSTGDLATEASPLSPLAHDESPYAQTERLLLQYQEKPSVQIVRAGMICGYSPVMPDRMVNRMVLEALTEGTITLFGGSPVYPHVHMDDLVSVFLHLLSKPTLTGIYNAGFENRSALDVAILASHKILADIRMIKGPPKKSYWMSAEKLCATGFHAQKNVDQAISELIESHKKGMWNHVPVGPGRRKGEMMQLV